MTSRASKAEMVKRQSEIAEYIAIGFKRHEIAEDLSKKYKVSKRAIERQYDKIINNWSEEEKDKLDNARAAHLLKLQHLYKKALESGQWKVASEIVEKQAKLEGLYSPKAKDKEEQPEIRIVPRQSLQVVPKAQNDD